MCSRQLNITKEQVNFITLWAPPFCENVFSLTIRPFWEQLDFQFTLRGIHFILLIANWCDALEFKGHKRFGLTVVGFFAFTQTK